MSSQTILREYLLSLGFKVDQTGQRKFDNVLKGTAKGAGVAGLAVGGLATTIAALAEQYARAMEKMYYVSRRGGGTVAQLQAMEYAGAKVGLAAGTMTAAVTTMAAKMRMNQGLVAFLDKIGVQTKGRTPVQEMMDLIDKTASMPYQKGASFAAQFGLDEGTYQVMRQNRVEMRAAMEEQMKLNESIGADVNANAKAMADWGKQVTEVKAAFQALEGSLATALLPMMTSLAEITKGWLGDVTKAINQSKNKETWGPDGKLAAIAAAATGNNTPGKGIPPPPSDPSDKGFLNKGATKTLQGWRYWILNKTKPGWAEAHGIFPPAPDGGAGGGAATSASAAGNGFANQAERFAAIEKMWGLTPGTLQSLRNLESRDGANMGDGKRNAKGLGGIIGDFQMNSAARKTYGVTNPFDEADQAAEMFADLKKRYGTDAKAAAAWNGGHNAGKYGPDFAVNPDETRAFVPKFMSGIQQTNNITINGGGTDVASAAKRGVAQANGDLVRELKTVVQ